MTAPADCLYCIDGMAPERSALIGDAYRVCPSCQPCCPCCAGAGLYPAWTKDMAEFIATYNVADLVPALCHTCGGVVDIAPLNEETAL